MKKVIALAMLLMPGVAMAQDITACGINIKDFVDNTRVGISLPWKAGATFNTVYTPVLSLHDSKGVEYVNIDAGAAAPKGTSHGYAFVAPSIRVDSALDRLVGMSAWVRAHVTSVKLPTLEVGIGAMLYGNKVVPRVNIGVRI